MQYLLFAIIVLQQALIFYIIKKGSDEREKLELKLMSKSVEEYKVAVAPQPKDAPEEEGDEYADPEDVPLQTLLNAKDKL